MLAPIWCLRCEDVVGITGDAGVVVAMTTVEQLLLQRGRQAVEGVVARREHRDIGRPPKHSRQLVPQSDPLRH